MLRRPADLSATDFPIKHREITRDFAAVKPLVALCAAGKLYEVETWIAEGHPIQYEPPQDPRLRRCRTPLQTTTPAGRILEAALVTTIGELGCPKVAGFSVFAFTLFDSLDSLCLF